MAKRTLKTTNASPVATSASIPLDDLTFGQRQKFNYLLSVYDDPHIVLCLVKNLENRGRNSWININQKLMLIESADRVGKQYHATLSDAFELNEQYSPDDVVSIVGEVRRQLNLPPHIGRLKRLCEEDFFNLFIAHDVVSSVTTIRGTKSDVVAYEPILRLKP